MLRRVVWGDCSRKGGSGEAFNHLAYVGAASFCYVFLMSLSFVLAWVHTFSTVYLAVVKFKWFECLGLTSV